jgi:hypothetical protein
MFVTGVGAAIGRQLRRTLVQLGILFGKIEMTFYRNKLKVKNCTFTITMEQKQLLTTARLTGFWYLLLAVSGIMGFMVFHPQVYVNNDPDKTLSNLMNHASNARMRLLFELVIIVSQALAAVWFYKLFSSINKWAASVLCIWGTVNSIVIMVSAISMNAAIDIAQSSQNIQEKTVVIQLLGNLIANSWSIGGLFFGLWLFPMGYIIISSKRMPVALGYVLLAGGIGYLFQTFLNAAGVQHKLLNFLVMPATLGELWIVGYLLTFGIRPSLNSNSSHE